MRRIRVFLFNGLLLTITSFAIQSISLFFNVYISNIVGTEAIGVYSLIISVYLFAITLANSGINLATVRIISEQNTFGLGMGIKMAMKKCLFYSLFMGTFACIILFIFSPFVASNWLHGKVSAFPIRILAISLPFISLSSCINGYFSALRNVKKTVLCQVLEQFFKIGLTCLFINFYMPSEIDYAIISLVLVSTISEILSFIFLFILFILDKRNIKGISYKDSNYTKQILKISLPISFTSYIRSGLSTLKQILIPSRLELSGLSCGVALSKYGIINGMVMPIIMFPCSFISSFSSLLIPEFSSMNAKRDIKNINFSLEKIFKFCFIFSFLITGLFWCFSFEFNKFIYPNQDISFYIKILCPLILLIYVDNIVDSILKGLDKQVLVMGINVLDLLVSVFLIYFILPIKGIYGYIIVLFISEFLNGLLSLLLLIKETNFRIDFNNWIIKPFFSISIIIFLFKLFNFTINNIFDFIFSIICFIFLYFIIIFLLKAIVKKDLSIFGKN